MFDSDSHREINRRLVDAWHVGILAFVFTCFLDFVEKVAVFILEIPFETKRPLHTVLIFGMVALVFAFGIATFDTRWTYIEGRVQKERGISK